MSDIELQGITWKNPRGYDPVVAASKAWSELNPGCRIQWHQLPWYEFEDNILQSLADGDGRYDLIMFDHPWTGKMASEKWLIPWDVLSGAAYMDKLKHRVMEPSVESYFLYGHQWALPLDSACHCGLIRTDMVEESKLPGTWEEMGAWAEAHYNPPHFYPLIISLEGVLGSCLFLSMMAGRGFPAYEDEQSPSCNRDTAAYVLTILKDLLVFTPPGSTSMGPWDIYERFSNSDDIGYSPSIFGYVNYFGKGTRQKHLRVRKVPGFDDGKDGRAILGGVGLGIAHTCPEIDKAKDLGEFLMSESVQNDIFPNNSGQPSTRKSWMDPETNRRSNNFYRDMSPNMSAAYIRPRYPAFHHIELEVGKILQRWWDEDVSLLTILDLLNKFR